MDVRSIRQLAEVMDQFQLEELTLEQNDSKVHLVKRAFSGKAPASVAVPEPLPAAQEERKESTDENSYKITSPLVGTFYRSPGGDSSDFVSLGSRVEAGTVVCIVEAMKVMNEIKAEKPGVISAILVEDGTPVEFGQVLFELKEDA